jgi:hypothetical protein
MNVEIGTEAPIFLFWEYLFRNFGILSLQCSRKKLLMKIIRAVIDIVGLYQLRIFSMSKNLSALFSNIFVASLIVND